MDRLKQLRKQRGYSQQKLSQLLSVNQTAVSQWERGVTMPSSSMILKLSELFDVTTDYLLGKDNQIEKKSFISNKREVKKSPPSIEDRLNKLTDEQLELVEALSLLDAKTREIALEQIRVLLDHKQKNNQ